MIACNVNDYTLLSVLYPLWQTRSWPGLPLLCGETLRSCVLGAIIVFWEPI